jgi:mono/diheme cytochrome c family protein
MSSTDRGAYLVHRVAMCVVCHSPRDSSGRVDNDRLLTGGRIPVESPYAGQDWAFRAPRLAGLPGWEKEELVTLLRTGQSPQGFVPRPPMPPFRMTGEDAQAVADYLAEFRP